LEVFGKKNSPKNFLEAFGDFPLAIADHLFRYFPEKEIPQVRAVRTWIDRTGLLGRSRAARMASARYTATRW
jgi:hypothetical protein